MRQLIALSLCGLFVAFLHTASPATAQQVAPANNGTMINYTHGCTSAFSCTQGCTVDQEPLTGCFNTPGNPMNQQWFACNMTYSSCARGRFFSDAQCATAAVDEFKYVCGACMFNAAGTNYKVDCGANGTNGVARYHSGCNSNCDTSSCTNMDVVSVFGQCFYDSATSQYVAINDVSDCTTVGWYISQVGLCNDTQSSSLLQYALMPQGYCNNFNADSGNLNELVTCPGYVPRAEAPWQQPFTLPPTPAPPVTTTPIATPPTTVGPTATTPVVTSTPPGPTTPTPSSTAAPTHVNIVSCTDKIYCNPTTCGAPFPLVSANCYQNEHGSFRYTCSTPNTNTCVFAQRYSDAACSVLNLAEATLCNQCAKDDNGVYNMLSCNANGSVVSRSNCTAGCTQCGVTATLTVGSCLGHGSHHWVVSDAPYPCSSVSVASYSSPNCTAGTENITATVAQSGCEGGTTFSCTNYVTPAPTSTPLPITPQPANTLTAYLQSQCADPHCSTGCAAPLTYTSSDDCQTVSFTSNPAAANGATTFSAKYTCAASSMPSLVMDVFTDAACTQLQAEESLTMNFCQRNFRSGMYEIINPTTLVVSSGCNADCTGCQTTTTYPMHTCTLSLDGNYVVAQRVQQVTAVARRRIYAGTGCSGTPIADQFEGSGTCNFGSRRVTCAAAPATPAPPPSTPAPTAPMYFTATFTSMPTLDTLTTAFNAQYHPSYLVVAWVKQPTACGTDCYSAEFSLDTTNAVREQFIALQDSDTGRGYLRSWFGITSLAAASPPEAPTPKRSEDRTEAIVIGAVCGGVFVVILIGVFLFVRARRARPQSYTDPDVGDYVAMSSPSKAGRSLQDA
jgi:hypothetical protein